MNSELFAILLSSGTAAVIGTAAAAYRSLRAGAAATEFDRVTEAEKRRHDAEVAKDNAIAQRDYWRNRAAVLQFTIVQKMGESALPEFTDPPESEGTEDE